MELPFRLPPFLLASLLFWLGHSSRAQNAVAPAAFRSNAQMILVPLSVIDQSGKTVSALRPQDFTVFDDASPQPIAALSNEDAPGSVSLVFDISGSMRNMLGFARNLAHVFFHTSNPQDEFSLFTVSTQPAAISGFTTDTEGLERSIAATGPGGMTALIDTVYFRVEPNARRAPAPPRHAHYFRRHGQQQPLFQERLLEELAEKTGGLHLQASTNGQALEAVLRVAQAIRTEYVIAYQAPPSDASGKWHRIRVKSHVPKARVYARSGYYSR